MKRVFLTLSVAIAASVLALTFEVSFVEAVNPQISPPSNPSPGDGATVAMPVTLQWSPLSFGSATGGYILTALFEESFSQQNRWVSTNSFAIPNTWIVPGKQYQWMVRGCFGTSTPQDTESNCGAQAGTVGSMWKFTTSLAKPVLRLPENNKRAPLEKGPSGDSVHLRWDVVAGATGYRINFQNAGGSNFSPLISPTNDAWLPSNAMVPNATYVWQVTAFTGSAQTPTATSTISDAFTFSVGFGSSSPVSPQDKAQIVLPLSKLEWTAAAGATSYKVSAVGPKGSIQDVSSSGTSITGTVLNLILDIGKVTWNVKGCAGNFCALVGGPWEFTIIPPPSLPLPPPLLPPSLPPPSTQAPTSTPTSGPTQSSSQPAERFSCTLNTTNRPGSRTQFVSANVLPNEPSGARYTWDFKDGSVPTITAENMNVEHTYPNLAGPKTYDVTLTLSNPSGQTITQCSAPITVFGVGNTVTVTGTAPTAPGATVPPREGILGFGDRLANIAFTALFITSVVMVLLSAFQFVSGGGNPEEITGARNKLIWAAVGFGIALVAKGMPEILQKILLGPSKEGATKPPLCPPTPTTGIQNPLCTTTFSGILDSILNVIFTISFIVVPLVIIYAGFLFVTGGGNPQQITKARNTLIWTAIGFGVILISKGLPFILKDILGF